MKEKIVYRIMELLGAGSIITGFIFCMCEAEDFERQLIVSVVGLGFILIGALIELLLHHSTETFYIDE